MEDKHHSFVQTGLFSTRPYFAVIGAKKIFIFGLIESTVTLNNKLFMDIFSLQVVQCSMWAIAAFVWN